MTNKKKYRVRIFADYPDGEFVLEAENNKELTKQIEEKWKIFTDYINKLDKEGCFLYDWKHEQVQGNLSPLMQVTKFIRND